MSKAEELAAKAARIRERQAAAAVEPLTSGDPGLSEQASASSPHAGAPTNARRPRADASSPTVRVRPVRLTVDVAPADHAALARWCLDAAGELGLARVAGQELVRSLLRRALEDQTLRAEITNEVGRVRATQ